ncbi:MAG: short-chain dehydrogenase/reductase [Candidatus Solibacter sp.]|nr:short-chain dehydrogenase/reductase [Candidatus Solibacter sp.]
MNEKVLIITGSTGISAATVRMAAARGARLVIATADELSGFELAAETGAECWAGDLTLPHSAESVLAQCLSKFGRVDGLFNAAGLSGRRFGDGPVHEIADDAWHTTLSHNLTLAFRMCRAVAGRMLEQADGETGARGSIVNMGSVLADSPEPRHFATHAYAAAKGAIAAMSKSMAAYYAPHGIRVNVIAPGLVRTPAGERTHTEPAFQEFVRRKQPLNSGLIEIADVARAALFLLGEESRSITGEVLSVDGGWRFSGV